MSTPRILLVDDAPDQRLVLRAWLSSTCSVTEAEDGRQAVTAARNGLFDLVLMDVHMPVLDGPGALRQLRQHEREAGLPPVPVVALTAGTPDDAAATLARDPWTEVALKPMRKAELLALVERLAGRRPGETEPSVATPSVDPAIAQLLAVFLRRRQDDVAALTAAVEAGDLETCARMGHRIKGSCATYGFLDASDIARGIEQGAVAGNSEAVRAGVASLAAWLATR